VKPEKGAGKKIGNVRKATGRNEKKRTHLRPKKFVENAEETQMQDLEKNPKKRTVGTPRKSLFKQKQNHFGKKKGRPTGLMGLGVKTKLKNTGKKNSLNRTATPCLRQKRSHYFRCRQTGSLTGTQMTSTGQNGEAGARSG